MGDKTLLDMEHMCLQMCLQSQIYLVLSLLAVRLDKVPRLKLVEAPGASTNTPQCAWQNIAKNVGRGCVQRLRISATSTGAQEF
jgi:hypothetical protein